MAQCLSCRMISIHSPSSGSSASADARGWGPSSSSSSLACLPLQQRGAIKTDFRLNIYNPYQKIDFPSIGDVEEIPELPPLPPPSEGRFDIAIDKDIIKRLDLSPAHKVLRSFVHQIGDNMTAPPRDPKELLHRTVGFSIDYERDDPFDPRELSEMSDVRLWFVRLDAAYPWLPVVLDWRAGELARYAAMLVPHQMSRRLGLVFNPEALELFAMMKLFTIYHWLKAHNIAKPSTRTNDMLQLLGFKVDDEFYELLERP